MQAGGRQSRQRTMEQAIGNRVEGAQGGGQGTAIVQGWRDLAMMRGGKEKYNNQQWLMGGGKRRSKAIVMMIVESEMAEVLTITTLMTEGGVKENDAVYCPMAAAVAASPCPPPCFVPHPLPQPLWWCERWCGQWGWQWKLPLWLRLVHVRLCPASIPGASSLKLLGLLALTGGAFARSMPVPVMRF
jgi:hypothetical protein